MYFNRLYFMQTAYNFVMWYRSKWVGYSYYIDELKDHRSQFICSTNHRVSTSRFLGYGRYWCVFIVKEILVLFVIFFLCLLVCFLSVSV